MDFLLFQIYCVIHMRPTKISSTTVSSFLISEGAEFEIMVPTSISTNCCFQQQFFQQLFVNKHKLAVGYISPFLTRTESFF